MCTRYRAPTPEQIKAQFGFAFGDNWPYNPNVAPTEQAPMLRTSSSGKPVFEMARFGLLPTWAIGKKGAPMVNTRRETIKEKPAFKTSYQKRRCLIPAAGFYEWRDEAGKKQPYYFSRSNGRLILFAGIWEFAEVGEDNVFSFSMITGDPNELIADYHDRMPLITEDIDHWLDLKQDPISDIAEVGLSEYQVRPVNPALNKASCKDLTVIEDWPS